MKKLIALMIIVVLATMLTLPVTAVEGYDGKIIEVVYDPETETCSIPDGYVVYVGDTLKFNRKEMVFVGDFTNKESGELETGIGVKADNFKLYTSEGKYYAQIWSDNILVNENIFEEGKGWKQGYGTLGVAGSYEIRVASVFGYNLDAEIPVLTFDVIDPKDVDEIVLPGPTVEDESVESTKPVESSDSIDLTESTEPIESDDAIDPIDSIEPTESVDDDSVDTTPKTDNTALWIVIGIVACAAVVVIIVLASKKKKV